MPEPRDFGRQFHVSPSQLIDAAGGLLFAAAQFGNYFFEQAELVPAFGQFLPKRFAGCAVFIFFKIPAGRFPALNNVLMGFEQPGKRSPVGGAT